MVHSRDHDDMYQLIPPGPKLKIDICKSFYGFLKDMYVSYLHEVMVSNLGNNIL
jgi:hypothetical protein